MYRIYLTDSLKVIGNLNMRYYDLIQSPVEETRSAEEIITDLKQKLDKAGKE